MRYPDIRALAAAAVVGVTALAGVTAAQAQATLVAASCFPQNSFFSKRFESIVKQVNEQGGQTIKINYLGGAPAIGSPFTMVQKQAQGVYDLVSCTGAYYQNVVPEADAWKLLERTPDEIRANGGWALMEEIHGAKNLLPLGRTHYGTPFHLYLGKGKSIDKPDLTGLHLRVAPIYTNFFKALGATTQNSNLAQIYPLMENGTVGGYGWPITGLRPGWEEVTETRVDPGFYDADINVLVNLNSWNGLSDKARNMITKVVMAMEKQAVDVDQKAVAKSVAKQAEQFRIISFTGDDAKKWLDTARDAGWAGLEETSPANAAKLRALFAKE
jgi:TRAP-type C4-dicarboxylate transport system substrate-binding protein